MDSSIMLLWCVATLCLLFPVGALPESALAADLAELEAQEVAPLNVERDIVQLRRDIKSLEEKEPPGKCYGCCSRCKEKRRNRKEADAGDNYQQCWDECSANEQNSWNGYPCCCRPDFFGDIYPSYGSYFSSHGLADWWTGYACTGMGTYLKNNAKKISDDWQWLRFSLPWHFPWSEPGPDEEEEKEEAAKAAVQRQAQAQHQVAVAAPAPAPAPQTYYQLPIPQASPAPLVIYSPVPHVIYQEGPPQVVYQPVPVAVPQEPPAPQVVYVEKPPQVVVYSPPPAPPVELPMSNFPSPSPDPSPAAQLLSIAAQMES